MESMRLVLLITILAGLSMAQFQELDNSTLQCQSGCCAANGGAWDNVSGSCLITVTNHAYQQYMICHDQCEEKAINGLSSSSGPHDLCCAPTAAVIFVSAYAFMKKRA